MYEIPQQLEYKEKIVFGLHFEQLGWAFLFFPIAFIILFRSHFNIYLRIYFASIPCLLAFGFMFFNLKEHLKDWYVWYKSRYVNSQKQIQQIFGLKDIEENMIITTKNKKLAVLKVESINFQIKPQAEQEAITHSFQKLLNSLDFPVQILMTTEVLSIEDYLRSLREKILNKKDKIIYDEYKENLESFLKTNKVLNRNFYVVIPEINDIDIQIKLCEDRFNSLNLKTRRMKNNDFEKIFRQIFDSGTNISILPRTIENSIDFLKIDKKFYRIVYAYGYPRKVESGFLDKIISCAGNFNLSLQIEPSNVETTLITINKELQKQRADLYAAKIKGQLNPSLEIKYKDTRKILENLQKGEERLFNVSLYINCQADSKEELDHLTRKIESELNSLLIVPKEPKFRMIQGFRSCLPITENALKISRNITTSALSAFFPFTTQFFKFDKTGIWFGLGKNNIPLIRDIFKLSNANGICLASSGAGKSYLAKLLISRHLLNGTRVMIIDPQGEYRNITEEFNGQRIDLSRTSNTIINPLDLMGHDYPEKRLALMDLMPVMLGELSEYQKTFLDKAITESYKRKGIYMDRPNTWKNEPPILKDVLENLNRLEKKATMLEKSSIRSLVNRLDIYVTGVFSFLNRHTNINFNNRFVCFDIGNMPKQVKPVMMFLVLDYVYAKMKKDLDRKFLVIDEAWSLLSRTEEASYIFEIVKTCRKFNLGLFLINQEVEDMLNSKAGRSVLANSSYTILLKQKPAVIRDIQKTFHLSESERIFLLTALIGEGIVIMEDDHSKLKIVASKKEHDLITTNADEIISNNRSHKEEVQKANQPKQEKINIMIDDDKGFFKIKGLSQNDIEYLISKGYKEFEGKKIDSEKDEKFLIRPRSNESLPHCFLCFDIYNYIKKSTDKVKLYATVKPDVVFQVNNKNYAIEVETGSVYRDKKKFEEKINILKKNYGKNWFFAVTDKNLSHQYSRFGEVSDKRYLVGKLDKILKNSPKEPVGFSTG
jgi:conjugal transfer ATP-binding protein TraC